MSGYYVKVPKAPAVQFRALVREMNRHGLAGVGLTDEGGEEVIAVCFVPTAADAEAKRRNEVRVSFAVPAGRHTNRKQLGRRRAAARMRGLPAKPSYRARHKQRKRRARQPVAA